MASKRRPPYRHPRDGLWWDDPRWDWQPGATGAAIIVILGILVYSCSGVAEAEPAKRWDLYHWIWPERPIPPQAPPVAVPVPPAQPPPVVVAPPPVAPTPPSEPDPPVVPPQPPPIVVQPPPFDPPPIIKTPTAPIIVLPPPIPQPQPQPKAKNGRVKEAKEANNKPVNNNKPAKPPKPKQKATEVETNEYLPPCSLVCWYAQGKTRAQLEAEAASRNPSARMRRHALACLAGCSK